MFVHDGKISEDSKKGPRLVSDQVMRLIQAILPHAFTLCEHSSYEERVWANLLAVITANYAPMESRLRQNVTHCLRA